jgi:hypothetical protein
MNYLPLKELARGWLPASSLPGSSHSRVDYESFAEYNGQIYIAKNGKGRNR